MPNNKASRLLGLNNTQRRIYNITGEEANKGNTLTTKAKKIFGFARRTSGGKHRKSHRKTSHHNKRRTTRKNRRN